MSFFILKLSRKLHPSEGSSVFLVVADGPSLVSDLCDLFELDFYDYVVCGVNRGTYKYTCNLLDIPTYSFSYHDDNFIHYNVSEKTIKVSSAEIENYEDVVYVELDNTRGSSALQAVKFGLDVLNFEKCVVVGCDLVHPKYIRYKKEWDIIKEKFKERIRAFSGPTKTKNYYEDGYTQSLFGCPSLKWLKEKLNGEYLS